MAKPIVQQLSYKTTQFTCYWLEEFIQSRQADPWGQPLMSKINFIFCPTLWSNNSKTPLSHVLETHLCYLQLQALYSFSTFFFVKKAISISWNHVCTGSLMAKCFLIDSKGQKNASQILFEGGFEILRLDIFRHYNVVS